MGLVQFLGGHHHPFFIFSRKFQDPTVLASWTILILLWGLMLGWIWIGKGAKIIVKYRQGFNNIPESECAVKSLVTVCVLAGAIALGYGSAMDIGTKMEKCLQPAVPAGAQPR
ncbi:MAG: hypothetical protein PHV34_20215 [Verrucomicrobiae bacterium]|nr:hypothetical protein [Verrucomicrobiae bacterium]